MRALKLCFGVFIGFIVDILGLIALGSVLASFPYRNLLRYIDMHLKNH